MPSRSQNSRCVRLLRWYRAMISRRSLAVVWAPMSPGSRTRPAPARGHRLNAYGTKAHLKRRRRDSGAILDRIDEWIAKHKDSSPPSFPLSEALTYLTNQREALRRFLDDPKIPLHNNIAERHLRIIAMGRKNFLFAGHQEGAQNLAILQSVVATSLLHDINPEAYLADLLVRLTPGCDIEPLLP